MNQHSELRLAHADAIKLIKHFAPNLSIRSADKGLVITHESGDAKSTFLINTAALNAPEICTLNAFGLTGTISLRGHADHLEASFKPLA